MAIFLQSKNNHLSHIRYHHAIFYLEKKTKTNTICLDKNLLIE